MSAWGDFTWPDQQANVRINGEAVVATWKDGIPYVSREQTLHLLHIRSGPSEINLIDALTQRGYKMRLNSDGSIDCNKGGGTVCQDTQNWGHSKSAVATAADPKASPADPRQAMVDAIGQDLAVHSRRPIRWTFTVVTNAEPNAWTPGEGQVFITTGMLDLKLTRDEIAGVLGHEIAHGVRQHLAQHQRVLKTLQEIENVQRRYEKAQAEFNKSDSTTGARDKLEREMRGVENQLRDLRPQYESIQSYLKHEQAFKHTQECEADAYGLGYAIAAGYQADGQMSALKKLNNSQFQRYGQSGNMGNRTHPPVRERINRLDEVMRKRGY